MLEIYIWEHYMNIFTTYYTDLFHMLARRREDAKGRCGSCCFHLLKKKKEMETIRPKAEMHKCSMVEMQPSIGRFLQPLQLDFLCQGRA